MKCLAGSFMCNQCIDVCVDAVHMYLVYSMWKIPSEKMANVFQVRVLSPGFERCVYTSK